MLTELHVVEAESACRLLRVLRARGSDVADLALTLLACLIRSRLRRARVVIVGHLLGVRLSVPLHHRGSRKLRGLSLLCHEYLDARTAAVHLQDVVLAVLVVWVADAQPGAR